MIAEAMAHGKPVVATRVGGIPELIVDGASGFLVDRGDVESMSKRVLELLAGSPTGSRMGNAARQTVHAKFNLQTNVAQLLQSYGVVSEARPLGRARLDAVDVALPDGRASDTRKAARIDPLLVLEEKS